MTAIGRFIARLRDLRDVDLDGIADGEVPVWDAATQKFVPGAGGGGGGGGGAPSGPAGGALSGTYPNPGFAVDMATQAELDAESATRVSADASLADDVADEATARAVADAALTDALDAESATRAAADTANAAAAAAAQTTANAALPKAGGTMTGDIVLAGDPTANLHPATRQYVAAQIAALIAGAPGTLDTLNEIATRLVDDEDALTALTAVVAGKLAAAANLADLADAVAARANLGLGSAATQSSSAFDAAGAAAAAQAASQPLDSDLTAIAALSTTSFGRALLALADAPAARSALALGSAATQDTSAFQAADAELAALAGLVSAANKLPYFTGAGTASLADLTAFARSLLDDADAAAARTTLGTDALSDTRTPTDGSVTAAKLANDLALPGNPTAATQASGNNTTRLATTAFVRGELAAGVAAKGVSVTRTAALSINNASYTAISWDSELGDDGPGANGYWDSGNPTVFTAEAGLWAFGVFVVYTAASGGAHRIVRIRRTRSGVTTTLLVGGLAGVSFNSSGAVRVNASIPGIRCLAGDEIFVEAYQDRGSALAIDVSADPPLFAAARIGS